MSQTADLLQTAVAHHRAERFLDAEKAYRKLLRSKAEHADALRLLGALYLQTGQSARAVEVLEKAARLLPKNAETLANLGIALSLTDKNEEAVSFYHRALRLRPDYVEALLNLAASLHGLNRLDEAIEKCREALRLQPDSADARIFLGTFLQEKGRHEEAVALFTEALQSKPSSIDAQWNKGLSLLALGQYKEGWQLHEVGLGVPHMRGPFAPERPWNGEDLNGKRLLIRCGKGLGDNLQFMRYAKMCKERGATVIVSCPAALRRILANCPFIDTVLEKVSDPDFDLDVPITSLPHVFKTDLGTIPAAIPYLNVSKATRAKWAQKFSDKRGFKVGLVWAGDPRNDQKNANRVDRRRSMDLELLRPLFDVRDVRFYNLQMGAQADQIDRCGLRERITDFMGDVRDFEDTAAIVEHLDLVISVDTSVVHLAGGMGKPVFVMSRFDACWRWLQNRPDSPWYPTARVFGQQEPGNWTGVVERVKAALVETARDAPPPIR